MLLSWVQRKDTQDGLIVSVLKPEVISISIGVSFDIALQRQEICHRPTRRAPNCLVNSLRRWCFHLSHSAFSGLWPPEIYRHSYRPFWRCTRCFPGYVFREKARWVRELEDVRKSRTGNRCPNRPMGSFSPRMLAFIAMA